MKNVIKLIGNLNRARRFLPLIIALVAVIGFSFVLSLTGCDDSNNTDINGVWGHESGERVTINGSTGVYSALGNMSAYLPVWQDAISNGYVSVGMTYFRNITSRGNLTWSMDHLNVQYYTSNPNVAIGTGYTNITFTMSADGQRLYYPDGGFWIRY